MWLWPLPVDLQGESMHLSVALRPDIATVGVAPAIRRVGEGIEEGILRNIDLRVESPRGAWRSGICVPFFLGSAAHLKSDTRPHLLRTAMRHSALRRARPPPASRTPPHRAPTAPMRPTAPPPPAPAAPSPLGGPASSARCPPTLRSPPRPRGAANRAGERVTPLFLLEPPGPVAQRT